ncbi:MAG: tetratricopeptide repeat protein, partial [Candidatus Electrothrix sp. AUS1_2]|nr:tetratricopeptide repeat protein [Candidatus Electrothrix sp. AUS1_2]
LKELNRHQEAVQLLESVLSREEERTPDLYILLAGIYQFIGQQDKGKEAFLCALKVYPEDEQVLYEYGLFLDYIGEQDAALKVMERLIEKNQNHAGALNYVSYTWADKKIHLAEALRYITRAVKLKPDNGYIRDSLGWVYYQQGEYEKARESLEMAVDLASDDPAILDHLAETYLALGQSGKAGEIWRKALDMYKEYKEENKPGGKGSEERESKRIQEKINRLEQGESK